MTRVVATSDWHGDVTTLGVRRFDEVERAVKQSVEHAARVRAAAYLFLGDLCDPDTGGDTFRTIALAMSTALTLSGLGIPSFWIAGNHDVCEDGTGATTLTPLSALGGDVVVFEQPGVADLGDGVSLLALPFAPISHGYDPAEAAARLWPSPRVVVASHLMLPGIHPGSETEDMPRGRDVVFPFEETRGALLRLQGHYHKRQVYEAPVGPPVQIVGSLARLSFGEQDHAPSFLCIDV